jgi:hypothetical protein
MMNVTIKYRTWLAGLFLSSMLSTGVATASELSAEVWKDPNCGCCNDWIAHIEEAGFQVQAFNTGNNGIRARLGIAQKLGSCHTAKIDGYAIEGHVPAADIKRLLEEKPEAIGLAVPGMPIGSPGMDGPAYGDRKDPYDVLLIHVDGSTSVYQDYR